MPALKIIVPLHDGETPVSFGSRLAQANGRDRVRDFALDVGLDFAGVVAGRRDALDRLAELGGCSPDALADWAAVTLDDRTFLRGQDLGWRNLRRSRVFACAACLREDVEDIGLEEEVRPWGRAVWQVPALRTCRVHEQELVEIAHADDPASLHDFAALALTRIGELDDLDAASERRVPDALEAYVQARLETSQSGAGYADGFPLYAVMRLSENLGAVLAFGRKVALEDLGERDLRTAGTRGFDAVSRGEAGIRSALTELQSTFHEGDAAWGPKAMFGRFYEWLAHENEDPAYDPVRDLVFRHVVETMPVGPGETVLNREVTERQVHSLHSASREYGMHPKRLRKVLLADGLIAPEDAGKTDERILFTVEAVAGRLGALSETMSLVRAGQYLDAPRPHERLLFDAGFIRTAVTGGTEVHSSHGIRRSELDAFLARLTASARSGVGGCPIPTAAKRANCSAMEIVRLLLDGGLANVGAVEGVRGYLSVLVDPDEVKALVRRDEHGGLSLRAVEKRMRWSTAVVTALVDGSHLPCVIAINPVKRCPQRVVLEDDLLAFDQTFASLHCLANERGVYFQKLKAQLVTLRVEPEPSFSAVPATFYRRADVDQVLPRS